MSRTGVAMARWLFIPLGLCAAICLLSFSVPATGQAPAQAACRVGPTTFEGWQAEQLANRWVRLTIVPQLGGRLMQVEFAGHPFLFVNPRFKGQYIPPSDPAAKTGWINYGGDKIWPLPEGSQDEQHWPGPVSGPLDDGAYTLKVVSQDSRCAVRLFGPADPQTGLQYTREIAIGANAPEISFRAEMRNAAAHPIRWSLQSVTQYDLADAHNSAAYNHSFWAFTPVNPRTSFLAGYHVRSGMADDPSLSVKGGLFTLHYMYLENEVWLDSTAGWIAVMDGATQYAMVERFPYQAGAEYPGKATVIFYKNGPGVELNSAGVPAVTPADPRKTPYYMEAELNSPMERLQPGQTCSFETDWFPTRLQNGVVAVTHAGAVANSLTATPAGGKLILSGQFGVFFPGRLVAHLYDSHGLQIRLANLRTVSPLQFVNLHEEIASVPGAARVSVHLRDEQGNDEGSLGEAQVQAENKAL